MTRIEEWEFTNLLWLNAHQQQRVSTVLKRALNGAAHIQQAQIPTGHVLALGTKAGWLSKSEYHALQQHSFAQLEAFSLSHNGVLYQVVWDHSQGAAVTGQDLFDAVQGDDYVTDVTLRFLTV